MSVTPDTIAVALGQAAPEPGSVKEQQWELWISDAEMLIEARKIALKKTDPIDEARLDYVVRQAVVGHIRKPDDATQVTVSVDDASTSKTYQSGRGRVTIADDLWVLLGLVAGNTGAYSVDMISADNPHLPWCSLYFGATYCSCGVDIAGAPIFEGGE